MDDLLTHTTIIGLVLVVGLAGLFVVATSSSASYGSGVTGFVVDETPDCSCQGYDPVCVDVGNSRLDTVANACVASCEGLRVVFEEHCGNIPVN